VITAIAQLGRASRKFGKFSSELEALVDHSRAKHVLVLRIRVSENQAKYEGIELEENKGEEKYLYRRDPSGKPGLFITGRIPMLGDVGVQKLQRSFINLSSKNISVKDRKKDKQALANFEKKKVIGITRGKGIKQTTDKTLDRICKAVCNNSRTIVKDICKTIKSMKPEELLLTVKILSDSGEKYLGEVPGFADAFKSFVTQVKNVQKKRTAGESSGLKCMICNNESVSNEFEENPLPFFFIDKPGFIPEGNFDKAYKVFPLCSDCFVDLRYGRKFVEKYLDFSISSIEGGRAEISFWLIPVLNDYESVIGYVELLSESAAEGKASSRFLYLKHLKDMCETMKTISAFDTEPDALEAFLTFTALFYTRDRQGHMRLISSSEGIYPRHLRFLLEVKRKVDSLCPFKKVGVRFGFPLLREFLMPTDMKGRGVARRRSEGWYKDLASTLGDMFVGEPIKKSLIYKAVASKIRELAKEADLKKTSDISFKALSLVEYIEQLDSSQGKRERLYEFTRGS